MMRKVYFLLLMVIASLQGFAAEQPRLTADAPDVVVSGDQFRLVFTVNSQDIKDFRAPSISGFDVLMGTKPFTAEQHSDNQRETYIQQLYGLYVHLDGRKRRNVHDSCGKH